MRVDNPAPMPGIVSVKARQMPSLMYSQYSLDAQARSAYSRPQKFGIEALCKDCDPCIEVCPVDAISKDWEAGFKRPGEWVSPGHKTRHGKWTTCWAYAESTGGGCGICLPVCPWNKPNTLLHRMVKAVIKRTTPFNRLLVTLDKRLGYGKPLSAEEWWRKKLPAYGIDTKH